MPSYLAPHCLQVFFSGDQLIASLIADGSNSMNSGACFEFALGELRVFVRLRLGDQRDATIVFARHRSHLSLVSGEEGVDVGLVRAERGVPLRLLVRALGQLRVDDTHGSHLEFCPCFRFGSFVELLPVLGKPRLAVLAVLRPPEHLPVKQGPVLDEVLRGQASTPGICPGEADVVMLLRGVHLLLGGGLVLEQNDEGPADNQACLVRDFACRTERTVDQQLQVFTSQHCHFHALHSMMEASYVILPNESTLDFGNHFLEAAHPEHAEAMKLAVFDLKLIDVAFCVHVEQPTLA